MAIRAHIELDAGAKTFATGLLIELIAALRRMRPGDLMAVIGSDQTIGTELEAWCRFTCNSLGRRRPGGGSLSLGDQMW
jgi:hypothetical protein